jgi:hypothetical protein
MQFELEAQSGQAPRELAADLVKINGVEGVQRAQEPQQRSSSASVK